ncbi:hypothetical protein MKW92_012158 [Papaver armeniacum]|nr:hypothetical protein MKW92_012158 [Papaver armeniacum]
MPSSATSFITLLVLFSLIAELAPSSYSQRPLSSSIDVEQPRTYIVHVFKSDKPSNFASHHEWYHSTLQSLPPSPHPHRILYTYTNVVNGFAARLTPSQASHLRSFPGIISILPERIHQVHTTRTPLFLGLSNDFGLWPISNYADDVIIGVLDTGIWPERQSFSDTGLSPVPARWNGTCETGPDFPEKSCNRKIIGARSYYEGAEAEIGHMINETGIDSRSPRDTQGHGTHTSSTAVGSSVKNASLFEFAVGEAKGIATRARIAVYKICWADGCFDSDIIAAFDQAVADGVDVISLSAGLDFNREYNEDSIAIGAFGAMEKGILVSCSAGNDGPYPRTAVNLAPWLLTVAASTLDREFPADVILGDGRVINGVSLYSGEPLPQGDIELFYAGDADNQFCTEGQFNSSTILAGKIIVCELAYNDGGSAVKRAGGIGMIVVKNEEYGNGLTSSPYLIPAAQVSYKDGAKIQEYIKLQKNATATIKFLGTVNGGSTSAPKVAAFSSRGPNFLTPEILKPDITAPGVNILAAWSGATSQFNSDVDPTRVEFNIISGTSMSCPHVSGVAALLRHAYPKWTPAAIKSALMTTAYNVDNSGKNITDLATGLDSTPFLIGAGHVDPNRALHPGLVYDLGPSDYIAFLCSIGYDSSQLSVFVKDRKVDCGSVGLSSPGDLNYPSFSVVFESGSNATVIYKRTVKNVESVGSAIYKPIVKAPASVKINVSPSMLIFSSENRTLSYEISFSSLIKEGVDAVPSEPEFGSIEWRDGVHVVRSPIVFKWTANPTNSVVA